MVGHNKVPIQKKKRPSDVLVCVLGTRTNATHENKEVPDRHLHWRISVDVVVVVLGGVAAWRT